MTEPDGARRSDGAFAGVALGLIAATAFTFGANYPWAYVPGFAAAAALGLVGLARGAAPLSELRSLLVMMALVIAAACAQLLPLAQATIAALSPGTDILLRRLDLRYGFAAPSGGAVHALSIAPSQTLVAIGAFGACALLMIGTARILSRDGLSRLARGLAAIGIALTLVAVVQAPLSHGAVYGFWHPQSRTTPFGPFVNRNHFAGWMLMTLPVVAGYLIGRIARPDTRGGDWYRRIAWLASHDANRTMFAAFATCLMSVALVLTLSRSAMLALGVVAAAFAAAFARSVTAAAGRRAAAGVFAAAILVLVFAWIGVDVLAARFATTDAAMLNRVGVWGDAWKIALRYPLAGIGLNTYGVASVVHQTADLPHHYDAAHNDYLQLAAEGGLLVGAPAAAALVLFVAAIRRRIRATPHESSEYWIRLGAVAGLAAVALQELADFSLQIPANAILFSLVAGIALRPPRTPNQA